MRTSQDLAVALTERMKNVMKNGLPPAPVERSEVIPGKKYRDDRGRMVTVLRASQLAVEYSREGYSEIGQVGRREFDLKFTEVKS